MEQPDGRDTHLSVELATPIASPERYVMKKNRCVTLLLMLSVATLLSATEPAPSADPDDASAITKLENDSVKADLSGDASFYETYLADDWTGGTSRGTWDTKQSMLDDMKDTANNKVNSERISDLKIRVSGNVAVATYKTSYDSLVHGKHLARTVISTDVFQKQGGMWKQLTSHSSMAEDTMADK